jgi:hypothetical protein
VAVVTGRATRNVVRIFSGRDDAIMARAARTDYLSMVNRVGRHPGIGVVAIFTDVRGLDVVEVLAGRFRSVVAAGAITSNAYMVKVGWQPAGRRMAVVAGVATAYVGRMFSRRSETVMTRATRAQYLSVINRVSRGEQVGVVTVLANVRGLDVQRVLAGRVGAVVAADTVAGDINVIESRRTPGHRRMAIVTGIIAGNVGGVFSGSYDAIMTGAATANYLCMVHGKHRHENVTGMAILADIAGLDMGKVLAHGFDAVVTIDAIAGDTDVIEIRRQPTRA